MVTCYKTSRRSVPTLCYQTQQHAPVQLTQTETQTAGAIRIRIQVVRRTTGSDYLLYIVEFIVGVRHRASTVFGSSSGGAGSSAYAQQSLSVSRACSLLTSQPTANAGSDHDVAGSGDVKHRASTLFVSSSGGAGSSAAAQQS